MKTVYKLFLSLAIAIAVFAFPAICDNPKTFTQSIQNKDKTIKKYQKAWDQTTIKKIKKPNENFVNGEAVAKITIPAMDIYELPVYYGSNDISNNWQITSPGYEDGYGMFNDAQPAVIGAHNYQLFHSLPSLKPHDKFIIENDQGINVYEVTYAEVYEASKSNWDDFINHNQEDYSVNLMACYPIDDINTKDMYVVRSQMISGTQFEEK